MSFTNLGHCKLRHCINTKNQTSDLVIFDVKLVIDLKDEVLENGIGGLGKDQRVKDLFKLGDA